MNTRFLVHTILACASLAGFTASAADLKDVYERALTSDPLIREADAQPARDARIEAAGDRRPAAADQCRRHLVQRHGRLE